jgi:hypothetical protein
VQQPADAADATALDEALAGEQRWFTHVLEVDWNRDGLYGHALADLSEAVSSVSVDRPLEDDTPGSEVVTSGASAAQLTVTLTGSLEVGGVLVPVSEVLAAYNPDSPLFGFKVSGTPVRWSITTSTDRGPITTRQFTGYLDQRRVSRGANRVRLTALDEVVNLDNPTQWVPWAVDSRAAARAGSVDPQLALPASVADLVCNQAGVRTRPRDPWETDGNALRVLGLPLNGSWAPTVGRVSPLRPQSPPASVVGYWADGPHGLARDAAKDRYPGAFGYEITHSSLSQSRVTCIAGWVYVGQDAPVWVQLPVVIDSQVDPARWAQLPPLVQARMSDLIVAPQPSSTTGGRNYYIRRVGIAASAGMIEVHRELGDGYISFASHAVTGAARWVHVHLRVDHTVSGWAYTLLVDGTQVTLPAWTTREVQAQIVLGGDPLSVFSFSPPPVRVQPNVRTSDVHVWQETPPASVLPERTVTPRAVIDAGLNLLTHRPPTDASHWAVLKALAAAEFGAVMVDEAGILRWRTRDSLRGGDPVKEITLAAASDVGMLDTSVGLGNIVNTTAQPTYASVALTFATTNLDQIIAPPGYSEHHFAVEDDVIVTDTVYQLTQHWTTDTTRVWSDDVLHGYVAQFSDGEEEPAGSVGGPKIRANHRGYGTLPFLTITVNNLDSQNRSLRLMTKHDTPRPACHIDGLKLVELPLASESVESEENITADGERRVLRIQRGLWHQHLGSVTDSARYVLRRATQAIPTIDRITVPGDPRIQLTDPVLLRLGASGPRIRGAITHITRTLSDRLTDEYTVRAGHAPARWVLGDEELGRLESTAVLG